MLRDYTDGKADTITMFVGTEVEKTAMYGENTLFVVGSNHPVTDIVNLCQIHNCQHVYLGANMSFDVENIHSFAYLAKKLLELDYYVTLDFEVTNTEQVNETGLAEYDRFIPMISVKIPYADQLGYNACVKVDDKDFRASNHGVWVHRLRDLMDKNVFTPWSKYTKDKVIKQEKSND